MQLVHFETIDSTNLEARRRAEQGTAGPLWILADQQTQGRGRRGRDWASEKGNLYCTGLYPAFGELKQTAQMSFVAALAVADTCASYVDPDSVSLKWPNDILVGGAKTAGILLESGRHAAQPWLAVGVGVNLVSHPDDTPYLATDLRQHIRPPDEIPSDPQKVCRILASRFDHWRHILMTEGFEPIGAAWSARAKGLGERVTVKLPNDTFTGTALQLGQDGELQVRLDNGTIRDVHAGDVFFGAQG